MCLPVWLQVARDVDWDSNDRGSAYLAIGKLGHRMPFFFHDDIALLREMFQVSASGNAHIQSCITDTVSMLREAYKMPSDKASTEMIALLREHIDHDRANIRLMAVQFASDVFARDHIPSRYLCLLAAGDARDDVREQV